MIIDLFHVIAPRSCNFFIMAAAPKQILVKYLERKKIINIPQEGFRFLKREFFRAFKIAEAPITFQRYNATFNEYVDLEESEPINDKDRLQAIILVEKVNTF